MSFAEELISSASQWNQTYDIDRWGNRAVNTSSTYIPSPGLTPQSLNAFDTATNRIKPAVMTGIGYDTSGNLTSQPNPVSGNDTIVYDAENHQTSYTKASVGATNYSYDGDGHRVKKTDPNNNTTIFVYNVIGQLIGEYISGTPSGGGTSYLTSDHLGSTRVVTSAADGNGNVTVKARYDYLPFGEEIGSDLGSRTLVTGYGAAEGTRQKFTQKERDNESALDYFGSRYYSSAEGRFTSADSLMGDKETPQALNLYSYAINNPLKYVDPSGHFPLIGPILSTPETTKALFDFFFGDFIYNPGDAGDQLGQGLRGLLANGINPGTANAMHELGIADTNLASAILRGAKQTDLGVPSTTRLVVTDIVRQELLNTGGFTSAELDSALAERGLAVARVELGDVVQALTEIVPHLNKGALPLIESPKFGARAADVAILAEAKAIGLPIFTNNVGDFLANAPGGGRLAERVGVDIIRVANLGELKPRLFPRLAESIKRLAQRALRDL